MNTYSEIPALIKNCKKFKGNSCFAIIVDNEYKVYSYSTLILTVTSERKITYFDGRSYSKTTSRLQNIIRRCFPEITN